MQGNEAEENTAVWSLARQIACLISLKPQSIFQGAPQCSIIGLEKSGAPTSPSKAPPPLTQGVATGSTANTFRR